MRAGAMHSLGVEALVVGDDHSQGLSEAIAMADGILVSAPPSATGDPFLAVYRTEVQAIKAGWVGYLSTTGVFGDRRGGWAFDDDLPSPSSLEGQRRMDAEKAWHATGAALHFFRLPGIYGPGRSVYDRLKEGKANRIVKTGQVFSRAHRDDIASALVLSLGKPNPGRCYSICDDEPAPPQDVVTYGAALLGLEPPPEILFEQADLSPMARRFYGESKRVSNARAKAELGWRPLHPTYREGLRSILMHKEEGLSSD